MLQHEIDHLDGVLILDRTTRDQRKGALRALREGGSYQPAERPRGRGARTSCASRAPTREDRLPRHLRVRRHRPAAPRRLGPQAGARRHPARQPPGPRPPRAAAAGRRDGPRARPARCCRAPTSTRRRRWSGSRAAAPEARRRLRLRPADPRAAALRVPDAQRAPVAAAALARRGADRARDHGRRRRDRRLRDAAHRGPRLGAGGALRARSRSGPTTDFAALSATAGRARRRAARAGARPATEGQARVRRAGRVGGHLRGEDRPGRAPARPSAARRPSWRRRVRGLTPHVGAYLELAGGERLGVRGARAVDVASGPARSSPSGGRSWSAAAAAPCGWTSCSRPAASRCRSTPTCAATRCRSCA